MNDNARGNRKPLLKDKKVELRYGLKKIGTRLVSCIIGCTIILGTIGNVQAESTTGIETATARSSESTSPISEWKPDNFEDGSDAVVISESGYSQIGPLGWRAAIADPLYTEGTASKFGWSAKPGGNANYADELIRIKGTLNEDKTSIHWKVVIKGTNSGEYKGVMRDFYRPYYLIGTSRGLGKPENWRVSNSTTTLTTYPSDFDSMETRSRKIYAGDPKEVRFPDGTTREFTIFGEKGYPMTEWAGGYRLGVTGPDREASSRYNIEKYIYYSKYFLEDFMQSASIQDATRIYEFDTRILPNEVKYLGAGTPNVASQFGNYMKWGQDFRQDVDFTDKVWITVGATSREATGTAATKPNGTGIYNFSKIAIIDTSYTDADKNDPQGRPQTVTVGEAPTPANSLDSVPSGSQVSYKTPVDTSTVGDKPAVVVVTYPDGSTDEIPVTVTVVDPRSDADKNDPQGQNQEVNLGDIPDVARSLVQVPSGSQVSYKTPVDTSTVGDKPAVVVVTYPDGSTDEIPVTVTVVDPRSDADRNDPQGQNQEVNLGDTPDVARSLVQVPSGSQVSYKTPVDTSTVGDKPAVVVVTYPDGSTDEIPVTVTVVDPRNDADRNNPQGQNQEVNLGDTPEAPNSLVQVPAGSQVSYKTPVDTSTAGTKDTVVVVTYPDGSTDEIPVTVTVVDPRSDADRNNPQGQNQEVNLGDTPDAARSLVQVPAGSQVSYKTPVDTSTVGDKSAVVVVTYPDGSTDEIPVTVTVVDPRSDADKNDPQGRPQTVNVGEAPTPTNSLDNVPVGSQVSYKTPVDTSTIGDKPAVVVVTYPDGSTDEIPVTVTVVDPRSDADKNDPQGQNQEVNLGDTPDVSRSLVQVPAGSQVSYKTPVDTSTAGDKPAVVVVTYPDGSTDELPVTVTVIDPRSDADKNDPQGRNQEVNLGDTPEATNSLVQVPSGSQVSYKTPVDTSTAGDKPTVVVVTYPDGSTDEISVTVIVVDPRSDADKNDPQGRPQTVNVGEAPTPANSLDSVPSGSQVSYKTPVDTSTAGTKDAVVVVTYPDGSTDEIPVTVTIVDPRSDADRNDPQGRPQTVTVGEAPIPANSLDSVPAGSQVSYKTPVDTSTVGDKPAVVVVTYPDGSTAEIPVTVTVVDPRNDADRNNPQGQNQEVNLGDTPDVARSLVQVPSGSQVSYKTPVDTSTVGDKPAVVVVTYPDGSTDEIPVTVTVIDPRSDADKNDPQGRPQTVSIGEAPIPANSLDSVPTGSQVSYKTPVDTSTVGDKPAVVVVTYPDGSTDEIPVTVTVVDPRSDADRNNPQGQNQEVNLGDTPEATNSLVQVPAGSQVSYKTPVDTSTVGDKPAVVVVTYPDGSTDEIPVTVTVVDPRSDADKNDPQGQNQEVNLGDTPDVSRSLVQVPAGSQVSYKTPVDTSTVGDKPAVVVVTYPDGSTDELPVTVTVVDPRNDADRNNPQGQNQEVNIGDTPDAARSLVQVPVGSQVSYKTPVDTSTVGDKPAVVVVVTYPDGSTDELPVTVTVVDPRSDADKNDPQGRLQTVTVGEAPIPANSLDSVPTGSQVSYKTPVDTSTLGDKPATVVVTYPDGTSDEVSVTVTVVDPRSDADKNNPQGQNQEVNLGDTPDVSRSLVQVPSGSQVSYKTPVDTSTVGDKPAVVVVTYPDGSTDEIPVTVTVVDPRSDADKNDPQGRPQTVTVGEAPTPANSLDSVPSGSQVSYKTPVDTSTVGDKPTVVVVTYPDGSSDEISVTVTVVDPRSDADRNNPQGQNQEVNLGDTPDVARSLVQVPSGSQVSYKTPVDTSTVGDKSAIVVVIYPDGSTDEIPVTVTVVDPRNDADRNDPQGKNQEVNLGDTPEAANSLVQVPSGSQVSYKTPVDTSTAGTKDTVVVVTYPDGSTDEIPVTVTIVDPRSDADRNDPQGRPQTVNVGEAPIPASSLDSVPAGSQVSYKTPVDTSTAGTKDTIVVVTYPDGSTDEIPVTVTVVDPRSDADKNEPQGRPQTVTVGEVPTPANSLDSVPVGSQVSYKTPVDTSTVGDKPAVVVVTYPDGSTDEIPVTVTIVDPRSDADKNDPQGRPQTVTVGEVPTPANSLDSVPSGSQVSYKTPVDTSTAGTKDTVVVVTYPDGSIDEIPVTVTVVDPRSDADRNDLQGQNQEVNIGDTPDAARSLVQVPAGSQVSYKTPVDTSTAGTKDTVVVVTYPDGSTDEIPVTVTVVDPRNDADRNNPQGQNQEVNLGDTPDVARSLVQVPSGSQASYKTPVDTSTVGDKPAVVVVTYPDGSTDEIPVTVTVIDPRSDADKNDPQGRPQTVSIGEAPIPANSLDSVPTGSQVSYKTPVDTSTVGDKPAVVVVTYPDGSTDEIPVTVTVVDPRNDADRNNPQGQNQEVNLGDTPEATNSLVQVPLGSQVSYKTPVDTSTAGTKDTIVVVTYPDGSTDEIPVTVTVVDPRSDADKNEPQGRPQTVTVGEAPIPANSLDSVPVGSQVSYKTPVDTSTVGDKPAVVVVTYPDGSTDELPVTVTVVDPRSDADKNDPQGRPQTVSIGEAPIPANSLDSVPTGSQVSYKTPVDTSTVGDKSAVVVVTYPDGSTDEISVTVTVVDPRNDADRNNPQGQNQEVNMGDTPEATNSLVQVPAGSQVSYKTPVDTSTAGTKDTVVVVTYPDGSSDELPVTVTVVDLRSDADKNDPQGRPQTVTVGETPTPANSLDSVPVGSQVSYKTPVDTSTVGDKPAVVVVIYPDGSSDELPVTVTVVDPRSDADRNDPQGQNQEVNIGDTPDVARSLVQVPSGSQVSYKTPVDTSTAGTKDTVVVVTYPDGSTDELPVTVTVVDPRNDADKNNSRNQSKVDGSGASNSLNQMLGRVRKLPQTGTRRGLLGVIGILLAGIGVLLALVKKARDTIQKRSKG